jgi:ABC-2 type transport system permease protein
VSSVWAVIRREYLQRVRSKWFLISTFLAPIFFIAIMILPAYFGARGERAERHIFVVDRTGVLFERIEGPLQSAGFQVERASSTSAETEGELRRLTASDEIGGFLVLEAGALERGGVRFVGGSRPSAVRQVAIRQAVVQGALEVRLEGQAVDVGALLRGGDLEVELLEGEGADFEDPAFLVVYVGTLLLYMAILMYAVAVMRSVLEEKTSRIVEVVISSMRPWHLMLGKILGVGAVGLSQLAVWVLMGALTVVAGVPALVAARPELAQLESLGEFLPGAGYAALFLVFFLGGYFMFAGLYAAVGAMCNSDQEAQQAQTPVILLLIVPIVFLIGIMQEPSSGLSVTLSLVPFFSPILMFARAAMGVAPAWQVALSVVLMVATVVAVAWVAGRIYKTGILMAGKRPTLPELVRWVREA